MCGNKFVWAWKRFDIFQWCVKFAFDNVDSGFFGVARSVIASSFFVTLFVQQNSMSPGEKKDIFVSKLRNSMKKIYLQYFSKFCPPTYGVAITL